MKSIKLQAKDSENTINIKIWMLKKGLTGRDIAKGYGCSDVSVSLFLAGKATVSGLVKHFTKIGCPEDYFNGGRVA